MSFSDSNYEVSKKHLKMSNEKYSFPYGNSSPNTNKTIINESSEEFKVQKPEDEAMNHQIEVGFGYYPSPIKEIERTRKASKSDIVDA